MRSLNLERGNSLCYLTFGVPVEPDKISVGVPRRFCEETDVRLLVKLAGKQTLEDHAPGKVIFVSFR